MFYDHNTIKLKVENKKMNIHIKKKIWSKNKW